MAVLSTSNDFNLRISATTVVPAAYFRSWGAPIWPADQPTDPPASTPHGTPDLQPFLVLLVDQRSW
jgi:hypothetical protein